MGSTFWPASHYMVSVVLPLLKVTFTVDKSKVADTGWELIVLDLNISYGSWSTGEWRSSELLEALDRVDVRCILHSFTIIPPYFLVQTFDWLWGSLIVLYNGLLVKIEFSLALRFVFCSGLSLGTKLFAWYFSELIARLGSLESGTDPRLLIWLLLWTGNFWYRIRSKIWPRFSGIPGVFLSCLMGNLRLNELIWIIIIL